MAKFSISRPLKVVVRGAMTNVIPNPQGIPVAVTVNAKTIEIKPGIFETNDAEVIERLRRDDKFGIQDGILEISEMEEKAVKIRRKKEKEADEEISKLNV